MRLPENFEKKMRDLLKEDFDDYIACYEEPRYYGLRVKSSRFPGLRMDSIMTGSM